MTYGNGASEIQGRRPIQDYFLAGLSGQGILRAAVGGLGGEVRSSVEVAKRGAALVMEIGQSPSCERGLGCIRWYELSWAGFGHLFDRGVLGERAALPFGDEFGDVHGGGVYNWTVAGGVAHRALATGVPPVDSVCGESVLGLRPIAGHRSLRYDRRGDGRGVGALRPRGYGRGSVRYDRVVDLWEGARAPRAATGSICSN